MFSKLKSKVTAQRFVFTFHIHVLTPWPAGNQAIAIGWQRGKRRRGATRAVLPAPVPGRLSNAIKFNESFEIPATMYKSSSGAATPFGSFKKKCVILAVLETDGRTQATAALGRVVIDLSEFASVDGQELRTFLVSCSKSIHAAVGEPQLTVTVRCRWKKAATTDKGADNSSMSTDTTGSTMTANLGSFMGLGRRPTARQQAAAQGLPGIAGVGAPNEQDLRGFGNRDLAPIHEDEDERSRLSPTSSRDSTPTKNRPRAGSGSVPCTGSGPASARDADVEDADSEGNKPEKANNSRRERLQLKEVGRSRVSDWLGSPQKGAGAALKTNGLNMDSSSNRGGLTPADDAPAARAGLPPRGGPAPVPQSRYSGIRPPAVAPISAGPFMPAGVTDESQAEHSSDSDDMKSPAPRAPIPQRSTSPRAEINGKWRNRWSRTLSTDSNEAAPPPERQISVSASADAPTFKSFASAMSVEPSRSLDTGNPLARSTSGLPSPRTSFMRRQLSVGSDKDSSGAEAKEVVKLRALKQELVSSAAVEASVYMARARAATSNDSLRHVHTCARRLSRTIVCMGQPEGLAFARYSLHAIGHLIDTGHQDVEGMMWYWSNIVHMRGFMQSLSLAQAAKASAMGQPHMGNQGHWAANALVEPLSLLEQRIFLQLLNYVWQQVLIPLVSPTGRPSSPSRNAMNKGMDERAVQRWLEALDAVAWRVGLSNPHSHIPLLRQQILMQVLKRIDSLLLGYLLYNTGGLDRQLVSVSRDNPGLKVPNGLPLVDDAVLPFKRGPLTFGSGMNMKMAVTRLQQWAFETVLMGDTVAGSMEGLSLFPHMRAAADLLMMPKELLMDRAIRSDVCSCLPVPTIVAIVSSFQPDEFAQDTVQPEVIAALKKEAGPRGAGPAVVPTINETVYIPPTDDVIMEMVESGHEPGLEYGDDSESELLDMAKMAAPGNSKKALRYKMLHELWATGVPRKRAYTTPQGAMM